MLMKIEFPKESALEEPSFISRLYEKRLQIFSWSLLFLAIMIFSIKSKMSEGKQIRDFCHLNVQADLLSRGEDVNYKKLSSLMKRHPEVAPLFDSSLIQTYFLSNELDKAKVVGTRSLQRLSHIDSSYTQYAQNSLVIELGENEEALENALELQEQINGNQQYATIAFLNLMRIGLLQKSLNLESEETWDKIIAFLSEKNEMLDQNLRNTLISHLSDERSTIFDFISMQKS